MKKIDKISKRFTALGSALILALASLLSFAFTSQAQAATNLYWCEFASNSSWNIATNWNTNSNCSSGTQRVPTNGDSLVFDNSAMNSTLNLTNDISGLDLNSITIQGSGTGGYDLTGNAISLDNGITDTVSGNVVDSIGMNITLTASQTFINNTAGDTLSIQGATNLGTNNLALSSNFSQLQVSGTILGSGTLTLDSPTGSKANYIFSSNDTSFTGPVVIQPSAVGVDRSNGIQAFGSGLITVQNGGVLLIDNASATGTLTNDLNLAGSGISGQGLYAINSCLSDGGSCTGQNTTLTLSGRVTLSANTVVVNGAYTVGELSPPAHTATFNFTNTGTYNGFTLIGLANSSTIVNAPAPPSSGSGSGSGGSSSSNIKAPNTGMGLTSNHSYLTVIGSVLIAGSLLTIIVLAKRVKKYR